MRVLITGGDGFVGRHLAAALAAEPRPIDVVIGGLKRISNHFVAKQNVVQLDVTNITQLKETFETVRPTHVVHLAALAAFATGQLNRRRTYEVNFGGTFNIAETIRELDPKCALIFCSTGQVYRGNEDGALLCEDAAIEPTSAYAASKAAAELMISEMVKDGLRALIVRPFNHTGVGQSADYVVPSFAAQIAQIERGERPPSISVGNLEAQRDFLDVADVVRAYKQIILRVDALANGCVMNISSERAVTIREILTKLMSFSEKSIEVRVDGTRLRGRESQIKLGDSSRARRMLHWEPMVPLETTLLDVLSYFRTNDKLNCVVCDRS